MKDDIVPTGKYNGKRWATVPKSYLEFVANTDSMLSSDCFEELERRKVTIKKFHILPSAINTASLCMINDFIQSNIENQTNTGFYSYVTSFIQNALDLGERDDGGIVYFKDYMMVVEWGKIYPTIIRIEGKKL